MKTTIGSTAVLKCDRCYHIQADGLDLRRVAILHSLDSVQWEDTPWLCGGCQLQDMDTQPSPPATETKGLTGRNTSEEKTHLDELRKKTRELTAQCTGHDLSSTEESWEQALVDYQTAKAFGDETF